MSSHEQKNETVKQYVKKRYEYNIYAVLTKNRWALRNFLNAIKARTSSRKEDLFDKINFNQLQTAFPVWLVSVTEISSVLPLQKDLFDLVIFDESTQCDISSAVPILYRGKKVVISGDPKQLRHVSFLSRNRMRFLAEKAELTSDITTKYNFREKSLLDVVSENIQKQEQIVFLDEHYRSLPSIIEFSNDNFYENNLRIMTETPTNKKKINIHIISTEGKRNEKGFNEIEAKVILKKIQYIIQEESNLIDHLCKSIGVLSPFRDQVNYLQKLIGEQIDLMNIKRHNISIGTAHSFQGEEKDIMFLSFALDDESHHSSFHHLNRADVFNVSITRARNHQYIVTSIKKKQLNQNNLFPRYLSYIKNLDKEEYKQSKKTIINDKFLEEVKEFIKTFNPSEIHEAYTIAGLEIDLVVVINNNTYCIDLIGYPGKYSEAFPLERYKILNRIGIRTFPLPYSQWYFKNEEAKAVLSKYLEL